MNLSLLLVGLMLIVGWQILTWLQSCFWPSRPLVTAVEGLDIQVPSLSSPSLSSPPMSHSACSIGGRAVRRAMEMDEDRREARHRLDLGRAYLV